MEKFNFYHTDEIQRAKKEHRNFKPSFSITCEYKDLKNYIKKYELDELYTWRAA